MQKLALSLLALCLIRFEVIAEPMPYSWMTHVVYDQQSGVYVDTTLRYEGWCRHSHFTLRSHDECWEPKDVPTKKKVLISLRLDLFRDEKLGYLAASSIIIGQRRIRPIFVHCKPDAGYDDRFDTVLMVNGTIAVLNRVAIDTLGYPGLAIDESYPGQKLEGREREYTFDLIRNEVERTLRAGDEPVVWCPNAYRSNPTIDQVAHGDAEVCLPAMLRGEKFVRGEMQVTARDHYALPYYGNYVGLRERLDEMSRYQFGGLTGIRQLVTESVRGCSWAYTIGRACKMCGLLGVANAPVFRDIESHVRFERELAHRFNVNWIFDVSNQWLPVQGEERQRAWLDAYVGASDRLLGPAVDRYVYLTTNSITAETAPLLRKAGVRCAYVGIDGWDKATKRANYKTLASHEHMLEACKANDIYVRTSLVIGSGLSRENLEALPHFVEDLLVRYGGKPILSFGNFLEIVIPGSEDWASLRREVFISENLRDPLLRKIRKLYRQFESAGYLTLDEQDLLNELRIRHTQHDVTYEEVVEARNKAVEAVKRSPTISVTFRDCEKLAQCE